MIYPLQRVIGRSSKVYRHYTLRGFHSSLPSYAKTLQKFKLADIGEGITECEIIKWYVVSWSLAFASALTASYRSIKPSTTVAAFDPLCEVQSDKASVEITSPFDGVLKEILVKEGDVAKVGEDLCVIEVDEEPIDSTDNVESVGDMSQESQVPTSAEPPSQPPTQTTPPRVVQPQRRLHPLDPNYVAPNHTPPAFKPSEPGRGTNDILAMPAVRHYARSKGVALAVLAPGSGRDGRVEKSDVDAYLAGSLSSTTQVSFEAAPTQQQDVVVELNRTRYSMWKAMEKVSSLVFSALRTLTQLFTCRASRYPTSATQRNLTSPIFTKFYRHLMQAYPPATFHLLHANRNISALIPPLCIPLLTKIPFQNHNSSPNLLSSHCF